MAGGRHRLRTSVGEPLDLLAADDNLLSPSLASLDVEGERASKQAVLAGSAGLRS